MIPFFEAFGKLANAFALLEGDIRRLLAGLAFKGDFVIASTFLDSSQLRNNLKILRKLSRSYSDHENALVEIAKSTDVLVDRRNLFIHGIWTENTFSQKGGFALVRDLKTKYNETKGTKTWTSGQGEQVNLKEFKKLFEEISRITCLIDELIERIENEDEIEFPEHTSYCSSMTQLMNLDENNQLSPIE